MYQLSDEIFHRLAVGIRALGSRPSRGGLRRCRPWRALGCGGHSVGRSRLGSRVQDCYGRRPHRGSGGDGANFSRGDDFDGWSRQLDCWISSDGEDRRPRGRRLNKKWFSQGQFKRFLKDHSWEFYQMFISVKKFWQLPKFYGCANAKARSWSGLL